MEHLILKSLKCIFYNYFYFGIYYFQNLINLADYYHPAMVLDKKFGTP